MEKSKTYSEAMAEVEAILAGFENGDMDVDRLSAEVKRATELIKFCKSRLNTAEKDVAKILEDKR